MLSFLLLTHLYCISFYFKNNISVGLIKGDIIFIVFLIINLTIECFIALLDDKKRGKEMIL
jgi:hypothetical protein